MTTEIMQMKISLDWVKPEIWRRFIVDSSITLATLHQIIQTIMGWENCHLYGFDIDGKEYGPKDLEFEGKDSKKAILNKLRLKHNYKIGYVYDFGDDWQHTIIVEKIWTTEENTHTPNCLDGARNCPPEDCGSIPGYEDIVKAMKKPKSKEAKEIIEWLGEIYDSEKFDKEEINSNFEPVKTKRRK